jgi:hypothetical protein
MAKIVDLPDGTKGEFPDSMSDAAIEGVLQKQFPPSTPLGGDVDTAIGATVGEGYKADPQAVASALPRALEGLQGGLMKFRNQPSTNPATLLQQLTESEPEKAIRAQDVASYEAKKPGLGMAGSVGEAIPEMVAGAALTGGAANVATPALGFAGRVAPWLANVLSNAGYEGGKKALQGGTLPEVGEAAGWGGVGGGVGHAIGGAAQHGASRAVSPGASRLIDEGVTLTPGQMMGRSASKGEEALTYVPGIGGGIQRARDRSLQQYSRAEVNNALRPLGVETREVGEDAIAQGRQLISDAYDEAKGRIVLPRNARQQAVIAADNDIRREVPLLSQTNRNALIDLVQRRVLGRGPNRSAEISGVEFKDMDTELGDLIRRRSKPTSSAEEQEMADALRILQSHLRDRVAPGANGTVDDVARLTDANQAFRNLVPVRKAGSKAAGDIGEFNPTQMFRSAEQANVQQSPLNRPAREVIPGSPGRPMSVLRKSMQILGGGGGAVAAPAVTVPAWLAANAAYSRPALSLLNRGVPGVNAVFRRSPLSAAQLGARVGADEANDLHLRLRKALQQEEE